MWRMRCGMEEDGLYTPVPAVAACLTKYPFSGVCRDTSCISVYLALQNQTQVVRDTVMSRPPNNACCLLQPWNVLSSSECGCWLPRLPACPTRTTRSGVCRDTLWSNIFLTTITESDTLPSSFRIDMANNHSKATMIYANRPPLMIFCSTTTTRCTWPETVNGYSQERASTRERTSPSATGKPRASTSTSVPYESHPRCRGMCSFHLLAQADSRQSPHEIRRS